MPNVAWVFLSIQIHEFQSKNQVKNKHVSRGKFLMCAKRWGGTSIKIFY